MRVGWVGSISAVFYCWISATVLPSPTFLVMFSSLSLLICLLSFSVPRSSYPLDFTHNPESSYPLDFTHNPESFLFLVNSRSYLHSFLVWIGCIYYCKARKDGQTQQPNFIAKIYGRWLPTNHLLHPLHPSGTSRWRRSARMSSDGWLG